jgi:biopolymer transport protein TolR
MAYAIRRERRSKRRRAAPELILTPLIDTVLVLLVVFMLTTPLLHNAITVELPTSSTNDQTTVEDTKAAITVTIDKNRNLFINDQPVPREKFFEVLENCLRQSDLAKLSGGGSDNSSADRIVFVQADRSIPYGVVIQIVDDIKYLGGVKYVALSTEHPA